MTEDQDKPEPDERDSRLMDSLLERAVNLSSENDEAQIASLMSAIRSEAAPGISRPAKTARRFLRWLPIPLAAGILVAVLFLTQPGNSQNPAMAALDRSLQAEQEQSATREYAVTIVTRRNVGGTRTSEHRLFVRRREFAICTKPLFGSGEVWAGGSGDTHWLVPRFGPVLVGGTGLLRRELPSKQILETPFMSLERILERTKRFYELTLESDVPLDQDGKTVMCQQIVGTRIRSAKVVIPERVEIWADVETGFARRLRLGWADGEDSRWKEATAELVGTPTLSADFFQHTAHHEPERRVVQKKQ